MPERPTAVLRLEPHMLPAVVAAYDRAVKEIKPLLEDLSHRGRLSRPWTDDAVAIEVARAYNELAMDGPRSAYAALRLYEQELVATRDQLRQMEAEYRRVEGDNAELWGRRA